MSSAFERRGFADQLSIDTPEQVALEYPVAGLGSRFVAILIDHGIQFVLFVVLILVFVAISMSTSLKTSNLSDRAAKWLVAGLVLLAFLVFWGYFVLFEAYWRGQTPGKRLMKLRVIKDSGRQITLFESMIRNLLRYVDQLPSFYLAGVITMLCNKRSKRLGDLAAGTIVIHERVDEQPIIYTQTYGQPQQPAFTTPANAWSPQAAPADATGLFPANALAHLGPGDLVVIETFFARALDLPIETRAHLAGQIALQMCAKMQVDPPPGNPERVLETIALALRRGGWRG
jgi:uncharacterized RDD family membrane protein YckC